MLREKSNREGRQARFVCETASEIAYPKKVWPPFLRAYWSRTESPQQFSLYRERPPHPSMLRRARCSLRNETAPPDKGECPNNFLRNSSWIRIIILNWEIFKSPLWKTEDEESPLSTPLSLAARSPTCHTNTKILQSVAKLVTLCEVRLILGQTGTEAVKYAKL